MKKEAIRYYKKITKKSSKIIVQQLCVYFQNYSISIIVVLFPIFSIFPILNIQRKKRVKIKVPKKRSKTSLILNFPT